MLSQEMIDVTLHLDESFMDIDPKFVKLKKVNGTVWLEGGFWKEIPSWLKDVEISGDFFCSGNKLETLKNCPQNIGRKFYCQYNKLTTLDGCPQKISSDFSCSNNQLVSLEGCPENIEGDFWCYNNKVKLELPDNVKIGGEFINKNIKI